MPQPPAPSRSRAGLSMVETALVISIAGMLLAVALPTLGKTVRPSKLTEASEQLESLYRSAAAYYAEGRLDGRGELTHCMPPPAGPTPEAPSVDPVAVDFSAATAQGAETWKALGFAPAAALRYRYSFMPAVWGCEREGGWSSAAPLLVRFRAEGDLDGDGMYSHFERRAQILPGGELRAEPVLHVEDRVE
jgi:type II secretory pathway pseudopilin PulG